MNRTLRFATQSVLACATLSAAAGADTQVITLAGTSFSPANVTINVGDTVSFQHVNGFHTTTEGAGGVPGGAWNSNITAGTPLFDVVFDAAFLAANPRPNDLYDFYCDPHLLFGMTGTVQVNVAPTCDDNGQAGNYCDSNAFSTGSPSAISANKLSVSINDNDLVLAADNLPSTPSQPGQFIASDGSFQMPFQNGFLCVDPGGLQRLLPVNLPDGTGVATIAVDFVAGAQSPSGVGIAVNVVAGTTHYFQRWNRDPGVGTGSNLSDGIAICMMP